MDLEKTKIEPEKKKKSKFSNLTIILMIVILIIGIFIGFKAGEIITKKEYKYIDQKIEILNQEIDYCLENIDIKENIKKDINKSKE